MQQHALGFWLMLSDVSTGFWRSATAKPYAPLSKYIPLSNEHSARDLLDCSRFGDGVCSDVETGQRAIREQHLRDCFHAAVAQSSLLKIQTAQTQTQSQLEKMARRKTTGQDSRSAHDERLIVRGQRVADVEHTSSDRVVCRE